MCGWPISTTLPLQHTHTHTLSLSLTHTHTHVCIYTLTRTHAHACTHTRSRTHTHTQLEADGSHIPCTAICQWCSVSVLVLGCSRESLDSTPGAAVVNSGQDCSYQSLLSYMNRNLAVDNGGYLFNSLCSNCSKPNGSHRS